MKEQCGCKCFVQKAHRLLTNPDFSRLESTIVVEYSKNTFAYELMEGNTKDKWYKVVDDIIYYKNQIFLVLESKLKQKILKEVHDSPLAGHMGFLKTYRRLKEKFSWKLKEMYCSM